MNTLSAGVSYVDLRFQNLAHVIATAVLQGSSGVTLIDPGPSTTLPTLRAELSRAGIGVADITSVLLTHIHLDHAGVTGALVRENPRIRVYVHTIGAPHMIDPSKLIASATRLYGADMDRLWGAFLPVPADAIVRVEGGERLLTSGHSLEVAYTPGHASHHVSYFSAATGVAFVGDTAGVRVIPGGYVLPPTPPPDIDYGVWHQSLSSIESWHSDTLFLTHFGPHGSPAAVLAELRDHMDHFERVAREALALDGDDAAREAAFCDRIGLVLRRSLGEEDARAYETAGRLDLSWRGMARYLRKR